jgi:hypothetical protein
VTRSARTMAARPSSLSPLKLNGKSAAPFSSAPKVLETAPLKLGACSRLSRSEGEMRRAFVYLRTLWSTLRCVSTTPLGRPVDPDVK